MAGLGITSTGKNANAASESSGEVNINQGGLNVPAYPDFYSLAPVDADLAKPIVNRQDQPMIYAVMGVVFFLALLKRKK